MRRALKVGGVGTKAEWFFRICDQIRKNSVFTSCSKHLILLGAGEGNRTLVFSLEGCCSTIELTPRAADYAMAPKSLQPAPVQARGRAPRTRSNMQHTSVMLGIILCMGTAITPARAQAAADQDATIRTTIIMRSKASECPAGSTIFQMNSGKKLPLAPPICFVRTPKPAKG